MLYQWMNRFAPSQRQCDIGHEDLAFNQLVDVFFRLLQRDLAVSKRSGQRFKGRSVLGTSHCRSEIVGLFGGNEMIRALLVLHARHHVAQTPRGAVKIKTISAR